MPILSRRYSVFWFSTILCLFGFSLFWFWWGLTSRLLGFGARSAPCSRSTATGSCTPSRTSICHLLWKFEDDGPDIFRVISIFVTSLFADFWSKVLIYWKFAKNRFLSKLQAKIITKRIIIYSTKLLSGIFKILEIYFFNQNLFLRKMIAKLEILNIFKNGICITGLGGNYTHPKFQTEISIFGVLKTLYNEKGVTSFLACIVGSSRHRRRKLIAYSESWENSEPETCVSNGKILISKFDLIWPGMDLTSANSQAEWRHNVKRTVYL